MNYMNGKTEPKEIKRNSKRKVGIMKIVAAFTKMLETSSEITHDAAKRKMKNFTSWINGTTDGVTGMIFSEAYDRHEREMKELAEKKED